MYGYPCFDCVAYPPQYAPTYQLTPPIYPNPTYHPLAPTYHPLAPTYRPATALGGVQAPFFPSLQGLLAGDAVDREPTFIWENRPTMAGLYRFTLPVSGSIPCAKEEAYGILTCLPQDKIPAFPFEAPVYAGAFIQHAGDGKGQLLLGEAIENAIKAGSVEWGNGQGQVQMVNRPYIYFEEAGGSHQIKGIFMYLIVTEDSPREGLDPASTTAYFNKSGQLIYEKDALGNVWNNPDLQGTTGAPLPLILLAIAKWSVIVSGLYAILGYFGILGKGAQRAITTVVDKGAQFAKNIADKAIQVGGDLLKSAAPWIAGSLLAYFLIKSWFGI